MSKNVLNMIEEESYLLIALHCSLEAHRVAFLINKHLCLKLYREKQDIDFKHQEIIAMYALFRHCDPINECDYYLISNKFSGNGAQAEPSQGLFREETFLATNLIPEYKNVDYFLKIQEEIEGHKAKKIVDNLNKIPSIHTAYAVDVETLKSKENLIFN